MTPFSWEAGLLPLVLGGTALYKFKKSQSRTMSSPVVLCHSALICLWGAYCFSSLSVFWAWTLFSLACCISLAYSTSQEMLPVDGRAVLITGGDSGIGHALSKYLDELGFTVFVGVLNENGPGAEVLKKTCSKRTSVVQMDITNPDQIKEVQAQIAEKVQHTGLWAVVNNAGVLGTVGDGELLPMNIYRQCMDVNFFGAVEVTKAFLPLLRKSRGRFINVSSMADIGGTKELWMKQEKDILENMSPDVLEAYGRDYLRSSTWPSLQYFSKMPSDFSPLFTDVLHGILCKNPSALYTAGVFSYLWICLLSYFPVSVFDYVANKIFHSNTLPKALT
ncbi:17-beta-hydroxysteroid dehydrogenase type 2 isoform X2 [Notamacropus eugenii]|uniref:17-beta-hydroxysteroid dehydrogenase type 2 isoform X2 n=1 Tax=Notamacropus eugenii TaxID=9315 RepID=UPI003B67A114